MATPSRRSSREGRTSPPRSPRSSFSSSSSSLSLSPGKKTSPAKRGSRERKSPGGLSGGGLEEAKEEEEEEEEVKRDLRPLTLISKEGKGFEVPSDYAKKTSALVETSLDADPDEREIPVSSVKTHILALIVEYMDHHRGVEAPLIERPIRSRFMIEMCKDPWDAKFIDRVGEDRQHLFDLYLAANYMDMKRLLYICAAKIATLIKGQPLDRIEELLAVKKPEGKEEKKEGKEEKKESPKRGGKRAKKGSR